MFTEWALRGRTLPTINRLISVGIPIAIGMPTDKGPDTTGCVILTHLGISLRDRTIYSKYFPFNPLPMDWRTLQSLGWVRMVLLTVFFAGSAISSYAQSQTITGKVTSSEDNLGLPGANVLIKGTARGTVTDADGNYSIEVSRGDATLVFSSIGFTTVEVPVSGRTVINVALVQDITQLSEIVVVGYGSVKKSDVTGALSKVTADVIQERPTQNLFQALQGKAAGVNISSNFKPGELPVVRVRGNRSLEAGNDPLYVIDGIPLVSGSISDISPNDIASIEVLKDASATAIYG